MLGTVAGRVARLERGRGLLTCPQCGGLGVWVTRFENDPCPWMREPLRNTGCPACGRKREIVVRYVRVNAIGEPIAP